jgi:hypothetical protein
VKPMMKAMMKAKKNPKPKPLKLPKEEGTASLRIKTQGRKGK